jgi:hypothetical protein
MFGTGVEGTIIGAAIAHWFAHGWYLNTRLQVVHKKLDDILDQFEGLRRYLYEIDPQFDDERSLSDEFDGKLAKGVDTGFSAPAHIALLERKEKRGRRTLTTRFVPF